MNTKLNAVTDGKGRPIGLFMTVGQISDSTGAAALLDNQGAMALGRPGYDADWLRDALLGIKPCISGRKSRTEPITYDKRRYKRRNRIEIMFGRLKDRRRVATRYDRCPTVFHCSRGNHPLLAMSPVLSSLVDPGLPVAELKPWQHQSKSATRTSQLADGFQSMVET